MKTGIREHALLYGLLVRNTLHTAGETQGSVYIKQFTDLYGERRGERMRRNTDAHHDPADISSFLIYGEWKGEPGENQSEMRFEDQQTISEVSLCAWYETWKKYDLLAYGPYYCRYIDLAICRGYAGSFSLDVKESFGSGCGRCIFCWNQKADPERIREEKKKNGDQYILPFSVHCREILDAFRTIIPDASLRDAVLQKTEEDFMELLPDAGRSLFR